MNAIPLSNRTYAENQQLSGDDNIDMLITEELLSDANGVLNGSEHREPNHELNEQNSSATNIVWESSNSPLRRGYRGRESERSTAAARPTMRKSPQFLYLTTSLVVAILAVIIAKEPLRQPYTLTQPEASVVASATTPSWHEWLNIGRKAPKILVPKDGIEIASKRTIHPTVVDSVIHSSSSPYYRKVTLTVLSFVAQAKQYMARYIDPVLLGRVPASAAVTPSSAAIQLPQQEENYSDNSQKQQQSKEVKSYSVSAVFTELMDKVISSKPRLMIFVNLILSLCLVTHVAIASYFLGDTRETASDIRGRLPARVDDGTVGFFPPTDYYSNNSFDHQPFGGRGEGGRRPPPSEHHHTTSSTYALRTVCGYLLFKLLLISSVLSPLHTLDVLILLTWFTVLCFQRSLAYMAHMNLNRLMMQQTSVIHNQQRSNKTRNNSATGILQLLLIVLCLTFSSGFGWVMFFYKAGIPMVILLLLDSAILIVDILRYIVIYVQGIILEGSYQAKINELEEIQLHQSCGLVDADGSIQANHSYGEKVQASRKNSPIKIKWKKEKGRYEARSIEKDIERAEIHQAFYSSVLQSIIFTLELLSSVVTAFHFLHIWYLHGLSFGIVDAILLLHLQSSVSGVVRKVSDRHQRFRLSRSLNLIFQDATETEMRQAHACGDLCCICLGSMLGKNVKKLKCGHMYHSHCLRKVVERARSITASRCPICRSSIVGKRRSEERPESRPRDFEGLNLEPHENEESFEMNETVPATATADPQLQHLGNDGALFRFSTEGFLPHWIPLPAISFEIVRRQANSDVQYDAAGESTEVRAERTALVDPAAAQESTTTMIENQRSGPFLHRLLGMVFAPPMSPEEEDAALAQLVEMFPQYEREDLRRELQSRNSIEQVAESIFLGSFSGLPRIEH